MGIFTSKKNVDFGFWKEIRSARVAGRGVGVNREIIRHF